MKRFTCLTLAMGLLVAALACGQAHGQTPDDEHGSFWMKKKLEYSENILAGLAKEDFDGIAQSARSMRALSQMERWVRASLPEYKAQLRIFENANDQLIRTADARQLDGAALAYVQLTLSCVNCHKIVRDGAAASAER